MLPNFGSNDLFPCFWTGVLCSQSGQLGLTWRRRVPSGSKTGHLERGLWWLWSRYNMYWRMCILSLGHHWNLLALLAWPLPAHWLFLHLLSSDYLWGPPLIPVFCCITSSFLRGIFNLSRIACRDISIALDFIWCFINSSSMAQRWSSEFISVVGGASDGNSRMGSPMLEEGLYAWKWLWSLSCCLQFWMHLLRVQLLVFWERDFSAVMATLASSGD